MRDQVEPTFEADERSESHNEYGANECPTDDEPD